MRGIRHGHLLDVSDTTLEQWLDLVFSPPRNTVFCNWAFPTDKHMQEYLDTIQSRTDIEIKSLLLKFLIPTGSLGKDESSYEWLVSLSASERESLLEVQYYDRLIKHFTDKNGDVFPWEGITWILDLLPHQPKVALEGLHAYFLAHIQLLPDGRFSGLQDATAIIRARYIGSYGSRDEQVRLLKSLSPRDFEYVVERLYHAIGYQTQLTPISKDGGRDIIAERKTPTKRERILIECKRYEDSVSVRLIRALLGVVSAEKVNKGVLVTTGKFTKVAKDFANDNPRIELIDGEQLVQLFNEYHGAKWSARIDSLVLESRRKAAM